MTPKSWEGAGGTVAQRLAGKPVADAWLAQAVARVQALVAAGARAPGLALVVVGDDEASLGYVRAKHNKAESLGIRSEMHTLPAAVTQEEVLELVQRLNADDAVHGILLQLPLPEHLREEPLLLALDPAKDVDGLHPMNVAALWTGHAELPPCTPAGVLELLDFYGIGIKGKRAVVVGRSELVGRPMAAMLLHRNATVTLAHSHTTDLGAVTREADILVVATGAAGLIKPDMVKAGATVVDVGITYTEAGMLGDVADGVQNVAGALTPMPGGVGPLTIAGLMVNAVRAAELAAQAEI